MDSAAALADFDFELKDVRMQLNDQIKALSGRTQRKVGLLKDLNDFFSKNAEIELQYAKSLENLYLKYNKPRHERSAVANVTKALRRPSGADSESGDDVVGGSTGLTTDVWAVLLQQTKKRADARHRFATNLAEEMRTRLDLLEKETSVVSKRCLDLGVQLQTDMTRSFKTLDENLKSYHNAQSKLDRATENYEKAKEKGQLKKGEKYRDKVAVCVQKTTACRNEYILALVAANSHKRRYYKMELGNLVDTMDYYFHSSFRYIFQLYRDLSMQAEAIVNKAITTVFDYSSKVDQKAEKEKFFKENQLTFNPRPLFEFVKPKNDAITCISYDDATISDLLAKFRDLDGMVAKLDRSIKKDKEALQVLATVRTELGTSITYSEDGIPKSQEYGQDYAERYGRLAVQKCLRTTVAAQLEQLGEALGDNRPETKHDHEDEPEEENPIPEPEPEVAEAINRDYAERRMSVRLSRNVTIVAEDEAETTSLSSKASEQEGNDMSADEESVDIEDQDGTDESRPPRPPAPTPRPRSGSKDVLPSPSKSASLRPAPAPPSTASPAKSKPNRPPGPKKTLSPTSSMKSRPQPAPRNERTKSIGDSFKRRSNASEIRASYKFGANLESVCTTLNVQVPTPVVACIKALKQKGIEDEGLFRVPGGAAEIEELKATFERGENPLEGDHTFNPDAIAGCLKLYLRQLEDPVMTRQNYRLFVTVGAMQNEEARVLALRETMSEKMPVAHRDLLAELMPFLHLVSESADKNKMNISNLALVFGPTLMPAPKDDVGAMLRDATTINTLMSTLIQHHAVIFGNEDPQKHLDHEIAIAAFDYSARNDTELSFQKGDSVTIYSYLDDNWCSGAVDGKSGFIPRAYIKKPGDEKEEQFKPLELSEEIDLDGDGDGDGEQNKSVDSTRPEDDVGYLDVSGMEEQRPRVFSFTENETQGIVNDSSTDAPEPPPVPPADYDDDSEDDGTTTEEDGRLTRITEDDEEDDETFDEAETPIDLEESVSSLDSTRRSSTASRMSRLNSFGPDFAPPPPPPAIPTELDDSDEEEA